MKGDFIFNKSEFKPYQQTRPRNNQKTGCWAPSKNLFFGLRGQVYSCCFNKAYPIGKYPEQSISEIWESEKRSQLNKALKQKNFSYGCQACHGIISSGNYAGLPAWNYESLNEKSKKYPVKMEFELDNRCNLECVMCRGEFSSSIRKNREKLPPIESPYGDDFLEELKEYIPHLKEAHFLGGEPFLIPIYLDIWELMVDLNPNIQISVQTNATILTDRIRNILKKLNFQIGISIDSIVAENFSRIRKNGVFEIVWANVLELREYSRTKQTGFHISYCPMTHNYLELPEVIETCNELECQVFFNTVYYPKDSSFTSLSKSDLEKVKAFLSENENKLPVNSDIEKKNKSAFTGIIKQIDKWLDEGRYVEVRYESFDEYVLGLEDFIQKKHPVEYVGMIKEIKRKFAVIKAEADKYDKGDEAMENIIEVPFNDVLDYQLKMDDVTVIDTFNSFIMPIK